MPSKNMLQGEEDEQTTERTFPSVDVNLFQILCFHGLLKTSTEHFFYDNNSERLILLIDDEF